MAITSSSTLNLQYLNAIAPATAPQWNTILAAIVADLTTLDSSVSGLVFTTAAPAAAGTDQTNGTAITADYNAVTAADGTKGVILPVPSDTSVVTIINTSASAVLKVYPGGASVQINALTASTGAFSVGPGKVATFVGRSAILWYTADVGAVTATTTELNYVDVATLGTLAASKAWTSDASLDTVMPTGGLLTVQSGGAVTMDASSTLTLNGAVVQAPVFVADATPYTVLAANSGKLHIILEQTNSITLNLPVIAAGLSYKFIMGGVATEAQNWVIVATTPSFYNGGIAWTDLNDAESNVAVVYANGTSHLTLTVVTPAAGTVIEIYSNGTEWFVHSTVISDTTPAFT